MVFYSRKHQRSDNNEEAKEKIWKGTSNGLLKGTDSSLAARSHCFTHSCREETRLRDEPSEATLVTAIF